MMEQFTNWFIGFFENLLSDLGNLFKGFFIGIYDLFIRNPIKYVNNFITSSKSFQFLDWVLSIFFIIVFIILITMFIVVLLQLAKKYFKFSKVQYEKLELLSRMNILEQRVKNTNIDLPKINYSSPQVTNRNNNGNTSLNKRANRFVKLSMIDEKYKYSVLPTFMKDEDKLTLSQFINHFRHYAAYEHGLYYSEKVLSLFLSGMATSKIMILEGISGTGKTSLPYVFGKFISNDTAIVSVQPSWRDRYEMIGYFNEFTKKFNETDFLSALYETTYRTDVNMILLDEMNLARVEYYFADFLSLLELPNPDERLLQIVPETIINDPVNLKAGNLKIPENLWFVGTANRDDSTFAITDKVYDRASSIEMSHKAEVFDAIKMPNIKVSYKYMMELFEDASNNYSISEDNMKAINELDEFIAKTFEVTFGNRIMNQLINFIPVYIACGREEVEGIDYIISRKILRKFETLNLPFLKKELEELISLFNKLFGRNKLVDSITLIEKYLRQIM